MHYPEKRSLMSSLFVMLPDESKRGGNVMNEDDDGEQPVSETIAKSYSVE
jgi:hypothetical protein